MTRGLGKYGEIQSRSPFLGPTEESHLRVCEWPGNPMEAHLTSQWIASWTLQMLSLHTWRHRSLGSIGWVQEHLEDITQEKDSLRFLWNSRGA